jgi:uncharacterized protein YecE (DUF72 family)
VPRILTGTSGFSYPEWVGPVYPEGTGQGDYLRLYGARFSTVEINFSCYRMPSARQFAGMLAQGGPVLSFSVKAHEDLTHKIRPGWEEEARGFIRALEPLGGAGRLEAVLFQFPYSFHYEPENRRFLDKVLTAFSGFPRAVEFRNARWFQDRVFEGLAKRGAVLVSLDLPELRGLPPGEDPRRPEPLTGPFAYLRLHGRNAAAWWEGEGSARYNYRYSPGELEELAGRARRLSARTEKLLVYFNNHPLGYAALNAAALEELLGGE